MQNGTSSTRLICRTVGQTSSFGSNPAEQNIGLGANARVVAVDIRWPASGTQQHFTGIGKNQYVEIKEFATDYAILKRSPFRLGKSTPATMASASPKAD